MRVLWTSGVGGAIALLWVSAVAAQEAMPTPRQVLAIDAAEVYADACAACHGPRGDGRGPAASRLGRPAPRDFRSGVFKFRSTPTGSLPTDKDLYRTISRGVPGTWMLAWASRLTPSERWALVAYIKGFSPLFDEQTPDPAVVLSAPPPASPELVGEGRLVYAMLGCTQCHGARGRGDGPSATGLRDDWGASIKVYDLTRGIYRNGGSPAELYRTLITGLSGTPMPALEPTTVAFPGGADAEVARLRRELPAADARELEHWLSRQPAAEDLDSMPSDRRQRLIERRLWALVHYVRSLERPRSLLHRVFRENPELQAEVGPP